MSTTPLLHRFFFFFFFAIPVLISSVSGLNSDGTILLSFKNSLLSHPSTLLQNWNHADATPCSWSGVTCEPQYGYVTSLLLPSSHLLGSIPDDFGRLQHLRSLDLSDNAINGTLPISLFNCSELQTLSLSSNFISGKLPELIGGLQSLQVLNLSRNGFIGKLPKSLSSLKKLTQVSLNNNYFSGSVLGGFDSVEVLDLSSNLFNGTLPLDFGGGRLKYLNLSNNKLSGPVYLTFAENIPANAVVDLSFNTLTGQIPEMLPLYNQKEEHFAGNMDLCGKPLKKICTVPSSHSIPTNVTSDDGSATATAAIAAIPKTARQSNTHGGQKVKPGKITAIVVGDIVAIVLLAVLFLYAYHFRKTKTNQNTKEINVEEPKGEVATSCSCLHFIISEETSETATESEPEDDHDNRNHHNKNHMNSEEKERCLVMVDGETELDMETLLKASAYILGSSRGSIMYKAVVGGGGVGEMAFAVRRIGESAVEKMREFEKIVRVIGKFRHRNLVKIRGFYWGEDEKLVIYDYVSNGSLAGAAYKMGGSSASHLSFDVRLKIAKGIAKGLSYIHDKKHVHGNIKPSNILLTSEMDPVISDFGLEWLISGKTSFTTRNYGNKRSTSPHEETTIKNTFAIGLHGNTSPYHAPESTKTSKWDVYSFGIVLLELLSGKVFLDNELTQWNMDSSILEDNKTMILKMVDGLTIADVYEKKDLLLTCFKLGFSCASFAPLTRPSMREALQVLEKIPCSL